MSEASTDADLEHAVAAIGDVEYFDDTRARIIATRQRLSEGLQSMGFEVLPSAANFVFARHPERRGADLAAALRERSIIVRRFERPRIEDFLRITVGTDQQTELLLEAFKRILERSR